MASSHPFLQWTYLTGITYSLIVTSVKCSILCLYLRIFSVKGTFTKVVYSVIVITVGWGIATLFSTIFQCIPVTAVWDHSAPHSHCINLNAWFIGTNVPSIILDFAILILPMRVVWHLKLSTGRKVGLSGIFLLGTAWVNPIYPFKRNLRTNLFNSASIISILRVRANAKINFSDPTWNSVPIIIWSTVEEDVGVICACLPAMAPLIRLLFGHRFGSSQTSAAHSYPRTRNQDSRPLHHQQSLSRLNEDTFELFPDELSTVHTKGSRASREAEESATRTKALEGSIKD